MTQSAAERYLRLGLQLGRHVDGIVDAYYGPPELAAAVDAEPPVDPRALVADAEALLDELERRLAARPGGRAAHLRRRAGGRVRLVRRRGRGVLRRAADLDRRGRLRGRARAARGAAPRRRAAGRALRALARTRCSCPPSRSSASVAAVIEEARAWTRGLVELPDGEGVVLEIVRDEPWLAFCDYLGEPAQPDRRQRRPADVGHRAARPRDPRDVSRPPRGALLQGAPARARPRAARGDAGAGADAAVARLGGDRRARAAPCCSRATAAAALAAVMHDAGIELDLAHALAVERALEPCRGGWAEVNAALMLHEGGASEAEVARLPRALGADDPELAAHVIRFLTEPTSRTYVITYPAGRELCRSYVAGEPERFRSPADRAGARPRPARGPRGGRADLSGQLVNIDTVWLYPFGGRGLTRNRR